MIKKIFPLATLCAISACDKDKQVTEKPNIIIILTDDMGYSDIGCFGSEIQTPNIDQMAEEGLTFTQFYNTGRSCPSRASLLTGMYPHKTGVGKMMRDYHLPGYRGTLNDSCLTIPQVLKKAGYHSYVIGKWHVGESHKSLPLQRGFKRFYGSSTANGHYFGVRKGRNLMCGNKKLKFEGTWKETGDVKYKKLTRPDGKTWYSTDIFTDTAIQYIASHLKNRPDNPFFLYLPYTVPHWPIHALPEDMKKYEDTYKSGWDKIRKKRYQRMLKKGIIDSSVLLSSRDPQVPAWDSIINKDKWEQLMTAYAAMIDRLDQNIGRLLKALENNNIANNTIVMFLSDNGGCAEDICFGDTTAKIGSPDSYWGYNKPWANLSNVPFRRFKKWSHEGGISTPFIIRYPGAIKNKGEMIRKPAHIIDIMATIIDIADVTYPKTDSIKPIDGKSILPLIKNKTWQEHEFLFWEHEGNKAIRKENWKLVMERDKGIWELYDMSVDRAELNNLADQYPEKVEKLKTLWKEKAKEYNVVDIYKIWGN